MPRLIAVLSFLHVVSLAASASSLSLPGAPAFDAALEQRLRAVAAERRKDGAPRTKLRAADGSPKYVNRLVFASSPYLQQHAFNPVNWYEWGREAFDTARRENKPVFLSIGYSTCHWCHVMEEESFDNEDIARRLNEQFIAIKVDREARPDLDNVYVEAVRRMTGGAGWPLTVFLTPDRKPFYGGTYYPPEDRHGRPGLPKLLETVGKLWRESPEKAIAAAADLTAVLQSSTSASESLDLTPAILDTAKSLSARSFDAAYGGFGAAPKFPQAHGLTFLLRYFQRTGDEEALRMAEVTLDRMANGGIYDHLGDGFHRYSVDGEWRVPHFEKMLYDQAINARAYLEAYQATGHARHADVARGVFGYVLRDLTSPAGAFYAAEDADSEGEEGLFYLWQREEIVTAVGGEDGAMIADFYGVTEIRGGPSSLQTLPQGRRPLYLPVAADGFVKARGIEADIFRRKLAVARSKLLAARSKRPRPFRDDKIITAWNGLMISTLAYGAVVLDEPSYAKAAARSADIILRRSQKDGRLPRFFRGAGAGIGGYLDDFAFLLLGLVDLYEATFDPRWLRAARRLADDMLELFRDPGTGGLRYSARDHEELIASADILYDGAVPSAQSVAALALLRLGRLTMDRELEARARTLIASASQQVVRSPLGHTQMLMALDFAIGPTKEIVIVGPFGAEGTKTLLAVLRSSYLPRSVRLLKSPDDTEIGTLVPFVARQGMKGDKPTAYVCEGYVCDLPTNDAVKLRESLRRRVPQAQPR